ncbi:UbiX family flavin prenyltransferase [Paenalcaligenes niemegkensis]|uniref:UbiX family flavin prenyltransferase n=1 Tax=Paenalcaligenes niemegkensis TaxID=2895469 RepID=UPI0027E2E048|nr:UbiX family flavin prenyltransferase [Paenalcaligenes niemegkensis]MCQ9617537.1 UbiX family flavin prenyltransferase [Paenalcaligenes niemegkensis]
MSANKQRVVIAMTGATGALYAVRMLQMLQQREDIESHLIVSPAALLNIDHELAMSRQDLQLLADHVHNFRDVGATLASGSFKTAGMVIVPCSMRTLAAVAHGFADNLITRAADVTLKERRRLILMVRETPFNLAHLRNMTAVTEMGGIVFPPLPAFYFKPKDITELVDHSVVRVLDLLGIEQQGPSWEGLAVK